MNNKLFIGISILVIVLIIIVVIFLMITSQKKTPDNKVTISLPTITTVPVAETTFTGAKDLELPKTEVDSINQEFDLKNKVPLTTDAYILNFDFKEDIFVVTLKDPADQNKKTFTDWLKQNYPGIPLDRFQFLLP